MPRHMTLFANYFILNMENGLQVKKASQLDLHYKLLS